MVCQIRRPTLLRAAVSRARIFAFAFSFPCSTVARRKNLALARLVTFET